jgi:hypothetical protein
MATKLTKREAVRAFRAVVAALDERLGYDGELIAQVEGAGYEPVRQGQDRERWFAGPVLCRDFEGWSSATAWSVVWEDGEYEWVHLDAVHTATEGAGVFAEPYNGFALSLYPQD